ncbi:hypothetical protein [Actinomadura sp. KC216]|uniref:hypothetical protein n=1 Tax=Actinomadura sp. KC216 TaxID=2530370 RepID=UPI001FB6AD36|nr:hypothetical protein [Actinomadura sp. KC216]
MPVEDAVQRLAHRTELGGVEARLGVDRRVAPGENVFEADGEPSVLQSNVVALRWTMLSTSNREVLGGGLDILSLDDEGRIRTDHQFIAPS